VDSNVVAGLRTRLGPRQCDGRYGRAAIGDCCGRRRPGLKSRANRRKSAEADWWARHDVARGDSPAPVDDRVRRGSRSGKRFDACDPNGWEGGRALAPRYGWSPPLAALGRLKSRATLRKSAEADWSGRSPRRRHRFSPFSGLIAPQPGPLAPGARGRIVASTVHRFDLELQGGYGAPPLRPVRAPFTLLLKTAGPCRALFSTTRLLDSSTRL
jgi:hypothetical protein